MRGTTRSVKIGQLLVDSGLITPTQLEQGLEAQLVFGGRLGTNLVELGFIATASIAEVLARQLGIPALAPSELDRIPRGALDALPRDLAARHQVFPLLLEKRRLKLAMVDPTDLEALDEIGFVTGLQVDPVVAPELLVAYALEKFYEVHRANRFVRLAEATDEMVRQGAGSVGGDLMSETAGARAPGRTAPDDEPYTLRRAVDDLLAARKHADTVSVLRRRLAEDFARVAVFVVDGDRMRGWGHRGCAVPAEVARDPVREPIRSIELAARACVILRDAQRALRPALRRPGGADGDRLLARLLGVEDGGDVLVVPVRVASSLALLALASRERRSGRLTAFDEHALLARKIADAVELVRIRARLAAL